MGQDTTIRDKQRNASLLRLTVAFRWAVLVALLSQLLFAHGCHGDEDHELFGVIRETIERCL